MTAKHLIPNTTIYTFPVTDLWSGFTIHCSQSIVQLIMSYFYCGRTLCLTHKIISIYAKFKISVHSIPTKKTNDESGHSHSETVTYWTTGMIPCCIECTDKAVRRSGSRNPQKGKFLAHRWRTEAWHPLSSPLTATDLAFREYGSAVDWV